MNQETERNQPQADSDDSPKPAGSSDSRIPDAQKSKKSKKPKKPKYSGSVAVGVRTIADIAKAAYNENQAIFKTWIAILAFSAIVVLILGFLLISKDYPGWGASLVIGLLVVNLLAIIVPVWKLGSSVLDSIHRIKKSTQGASVAHQAEKPDRSNAPVWTRHVPQIPIRSHNEIVELLDSFRHKALSAVRSLEYKIDDYMVRTNIFVPDTSVIPSGRLCELYIPVGFAVGMDPLDNSDRERARHELALRFWPNQGLAGTVFVEQVAKPELSSLSNDGKRVWPNKYNLTDEQKQAIHPDLRWIVSFPLKVANGFGALAIGVLNVDGVGFDVNRNDLQVVIGKLAGDIGVIAGKFRESGFDRLGVYLETL